jgi:hypothetical protein
MSKPRHRPTAHSSPVDFSDLRGVSVLGEPLDLLFSALIRLRPSKPQDGMINLGGTLPIKEIKAVDRAMEHAARDVPGDRRSPHERDVERFSILVDRVLEALAAVRHGREHEVARSQFERPALPG